MLCFLLSWVCFSVHLLFGKSGAFIDLAGWFFWSPSHRTCLFMTWEDHCFFSDFPSAVRRGVRVNSHFLSEQLLTITYQAGEYKLCLWCRHCLGEEVSSWVELCLQTGLLPFKRAHCAQWVELRSSMLRFSNEFYTFLFVSFQSFFFVCNPTDQQTNGQRWTHNHLSGCNDTISRKAESF